MPPSFIVEIKIGSTPHVSFDIIVKPSIIKQYGKAVKDRI